MQVGFRHFDSPTLGWLEGALRAGGTTRHALARELCERTGWRNSLGRPCLSAAAKALPALAEHLQLELPPARETPQFAAARPGPGRRGSRREAGTARLKSSARSRSSRSATPATAGSGRR